LVWWASIFQLTQQNKASTSRVTSRSRWNPWGSRGFGRWTRWKREVSWTAADRTKKVASKSPGETSSSSKSSVRNFPCLSPYYENHSVCHHPVDGNILPGQEVRWELPSAGHRGWRTWACPYQFRRVTRQVPKDSPGVAARVVAPGNDIRRVALGSARRLRRRAQGEGGCHD
jgi:hypothetical protein